MRFFFERESELLLEFMLGASSSSSVGDIYGFAGGGGCSQQTLSVPTGLLGTGSWILWPGEVLLLRALTWLFALVPYCERVEGGMLMVRGLVFIFLWLWMLPPVPLNMSSVLVGNCVGEEKLPCALRRMSYAVELVLLTFFLLALDIFCYYYDYDY